MGGGPPKEPKLLLVKNNQQHFQAYLSYISCFVMTQINSLCDFIFETEV